MNRLTPPLKWIAAAGITAGIVAAWPWNPPFPLLTQICGCVAVIAQSLNLYLGGKPIPPPDILKAQSKLTIK